MIDIDPDLTGAYSTVGWTPRKGETSDQGRHYLIIGPDSPARTVAHEVSQPSVRMQISTNTGRSDMAGEETHVHNSTDKAPVFGMEHEVTRHDRTSQINKIL